jgi:allantoate deiminase
MLDFEIIAKKVFNRLEELGGLTDEPGVLYRSFLSPAMARANGLVGVWMTEVPRCEAHIDPWGNLTGHIPGDDEE